MHECGRCETCILKFSCLVRCRITPKDVLQAPCGAVIGLSATPGTFWRGLGCKASRGEVWADGLLFLTYHDVTAEWVYGYVMEPRRLCRIVGDGLVAEEGVGSSLAVDPEVDG